MPTTTPTPAPGGLRIMRGWLPGQIIAVDDAMRVKFDEMLHGAPKQRGAGVTRATRKAKAERRRRRRGSR